MKRGVPEGVALDWHVVFEEFVTIWVVVDPIGTVPIFLAATKGMDPKQRPRVAIQANLAAAGILFFFIVVGQILLGALGISLASFRIAGGIILFLFALTMIFGSSSPRAANDDGSTADLNVAIFPLAVPAIAGPGAILAVVVLTDNHRYRGSWVRISVRSHIFQLVIGNPQPSRFRMSPICHHANPISWP